MAEELSGKLKEDRKNLDLGCVILSALIEADITIYQLQRFALTIIKIIAKLDFCRIGSIRRDYNYIMIPATRAATF